jgi:tetratricopeptide (TPR) repeat protein
VAKQEKADKQPAPAAPIGRFAAMKARVAGLKRWALATRLRAVLTFGSLAVAFIGLAAVAALAFRPAKRLDYHRQLASAFGELDKGNRVTSRRVAANLLRDAAVGYAEQGGTYYVLGTITLLDADEQINLGKRQLLDLVAARYLEEARSRGLPKGREQEGLRLLGRALHDAGRYARSISILREALEESPEDANIIHALLADCYLNLQPPKLLEALEHNRSFLASPNLTERQQDTGLLVQGRILLGQKNAAAAEEAVRHISPNSPHFPDALILQGRILLDKLGATSAERQPEVIASVGAMQDQLRKLMGREAVAATIPPRAQLLIAMLYETLGDTKAAVWQFDAIRRSFFGQPEALAATIFHGDLVRPDNPREAVALYKRALSQLAGDEEAYNNMWLPVDQFRTRLAAAIDDLANGSNFAEALDLAEALVAPFSPVVAMERQANIQRAWARQLVEQARLERMPQAPVTEAEARHHWRQAGSLWRRLADLRIESRQYQEDLRNAADDLRRGHGFEQAVGVYTELLRQEPQQGEAESLVGLGESQLALGKTAEALEVLDHCREIYPKHPATYQARLLSSLALQEQGKPAEAQQLLVDNLYGFSLTPQSTEWRDSLFSLGAIQYRSAMELEAKSRQAGVDRLDPESRRTGLALLEQSHGVFQEAIRTLTEAVERYPKSPQTVEARYRIAEAHRHSAKLPRKRRAVVTISASQAALTRQMTEYLDSAIEGYNESITRLSEQQDSQHSPNEAAILRNCYFGRADALFDVERYDQAIQAYSAATNRYQHDPESLEAYVQIASCHRRMGRISEARGTLEQARVVLQRIRPDANFTRTTRLARQDWIPLLDWLRTL